MLYSKSFVLDQVVKVLKEVVIPECQTEKAREQAIAMVSVLKNLDSHTLDNHEVRKQENEELAGVLLEIAQEIQRDPRLARTSLHQWAEQLQDGYREQESNTSDDLARWNRLNQQLCELIQRLHADEGAADGRDATREKYLRRIRRLLRKQLDRQLKRIH